uniref:DNA-directed RNA polymerase subunit beta n=1 Tax=Nitzschia sp. PL1-4 TaxID=2083272 RepID=A0A2Z5ZAZ5_9STRA|nr:RNA polymerase beta subunit [Nitzschia sp. PL1-4]
MNNNSIFSNMLEAHRHSFCWFLTYSLKEELYLVSKASPLSNPKTNYIILGDEYTLNIPRYKESNKHIIERIDNYNIIIIQIPIILKVKKRKKNYLKRENLNLYLPIMTTYATFLINDCERALISQISRRPGIYFEKNVFNKDKNLLNFDFYYLKDLYSSFKEKKEEKNFQKGIKKLLIFDKILEKIYSAIIIPDQGSWIHFKIKYQIQDNTNLDILIQFNKFFEISVFNLFKKIGLTDFEIYKNLHYANWFYSKEPSKSNFNIKNLDIIKNNINFLKIFDPVEVSLGSTGRSRINEQLDLPINENLICITYEDLFSIIDRLIELIIREQFIEDIDHLKNRRIKLPGEILHNIIKLGFYRLYKNMSKKGFFSNPWKLNFNPNILSITLIEFFNSSPLSQLLDQTNPLSSLTHKRRISYYGPGGLKKGAATFKIRDIHPSQYGKICPVETVEGSNVGLVNSLATCTKINKLGLLETPFWRVINGRVLKEIDPIYLTADVEDLYKIAAADTLVDNKNYLVNNLITARYRQRFISVVPAEIDFLAISTVQVVSIAASLVPFFEHNDANRVLMGSSMQRQSIPLLFAQKPIVGTGLENQVVNNSEMVLRSESDGIVDFVSSDKITIKNSNGNLLTYKLDKYSFSNKKTCINQKPIVWKGERIKHGQVLTDGPSIIDNELSLGRNLLVAYMPWHGYNFEDAIIINERLIYDNIFTSIHIEKYKIEISKKGEYITRKVPRKKNSFSIENLDENGIIKIGVVVKPGDILVGKVSPFLKKKESPIFRLMRAALKRKAARTIDESLKLPNGKYGRVINTETYSSIKSGIINKVIIHIAQMRRIQVGDKLAGRHGNKGVISKILARQDMPFLPDGTPIDIILNPLGVPSRMNVGQLYECLLGLAGDKLNKRFKVLPFDEMYGLESSRILINKKLREASIKQNKSWLFNPYMPGKMVLIDGRTGTEFENPITVGNAYILKLIHMVEDKIHSRFIGPYSRVTQQPSQGKSLEGGQRFGEMEVWALEGFGATYTLREVLTIKSDAIDERESSLKKIMRKKSIIDFGIPESFRVFLQELRALGLNLKTYKIETFNSMKRYANEIQTQTIQEIKRYDKFF